MQQEGRRSGDIQKHIPPEFLALLSTLFERGARELCKESRFQGTGTASVSRACNRRAGDQETSKNISLLNSWPSCQRSSSAAPGSCARNHVSRGLGLLVSRGHATGGQEI